MTSQPIYGRMVPFKSQLIALLPRSYKEQLQSEDYSEKKDTEHETLFATFILKKVMLVRRSTVDFKSCRRSLLLAGKWFYRKNDEE